jgi:hypothetical protein
MSERLYRDWHDHEVLGVKGRLMQNANGERMTKGLFDQQKWVSEWREFKRSGARLRIQAEITLDDDCRNSHNTFHITCDIQELSRGSWRDYGGGSDHESISKRFPELAALCKWHGTSTDGRLQYIANTVYHAGNRDSSGLLKGEKRQIINGKSGQPSWQLVALDADGNELELYKLPEYTDSAVKPVCEFTLDWRPWCREGEGKERNLDAARSCAVWPEATDEELSVERDELKAKLEARHPELMQRFRAAMDSTGLLWTPQ